MHHRENAEAERSSADEKAARQERERLAALKRSGLMSLPLPPQAQVICQQAQTWFGVATALVTLIDEDKLIVKARIGTDAEEVPRSVAFCDYTIRADDVFVVTDMTEDARFAANPLVVGPPHVRFYAGAPLIYLRQIRLGTLCLLDPTPRTFTLGDRAELTYMAEEVVHAIMNREVARKEAELGL